MTNLKKLDHLDKKHAFNVNNDLAFQNCLHNQGLVKLKPNREIERSLRQAHKEYNDHRGGNFSPAISQFF